MTNPAAHNQNPHEVEFQLPYGVYDQSGALHQSGVMRLATALDEIEPLGDPRTQHNVAYLGIVLLSRVLVRLGPYQPVQTEIIERLYAADYAFLQALYLQLNSAVGQANILGSTIETECPHCQTRFHLDLRHDTPDPTESTP